MTTLEILICYLVFGLVTGGLYVQHSSSTSGWIDRALLILTFMVLWPLLWVVILGILALVKIGSIADRS